MVNVWTKSSCTWYTIFAAFIMKSSCVEKATDSDFTYETFCIFLSILPASTHFYQTQLTVMRTTFFFISISISMCAIAQEKKIDSLLNLLKNSKADTNRAILLGQLSYHYLQFKADTAFTIALEGLALSRKIRFQRGEALNYNQLGNIYWFFGNYPRATESYINCNKIAEAILDSSLMSASVGNLGLVYYEQNDFKEALKYEFRARELTPQNSTSNFINSNINLALYYTSMGKLDSASFYAQQSYYDSKKIENNNFIGVSLGNLGAISLKNENYIVALEYLRSALPYISFSDSYMRGKLLLEIATVFNKMEKNDSAVRFARQVLHLSTASGNAKTSLEASSLLAEQYEKMKKYDSAYYYQKMAKTINDSLFSREKVRTIQNLELEELRRQSDIQNQLLLTKEERKQNIQYAAIAICLIIVVVLFLAFSHSILAKPKTIKFVGIISLLLIFEFLNLLLHPSLGVLTHHSPALMLLAMVCIAALLVPLHHKIEKWITHQLVEKNKRIRLAAAEKTIADLKG